MSENVKEDTHLTLACLYTMAKKGNFQKHKREIAHIMQSVLNLDRVVRQEEIRQTEELKEKKNDNL